MNDEFRLFQHQLVIGVEAHSGNFKAALLRRNQAVVRKVGKRCFLQKSCADHAGPIGVGQVAVDLHVGEAGL